MNALIKNCSSLLDQKYKDRLDAISLFILRFVGGGLMFISHGWQKMESFSEYSATFPDPLGVGSSLSLSLAVFAELACAFFVLVGFMTRLSSIPLIITMGVAAFIIHADDPLQKKELALIYLGIYCVTLLRGAGPISIDGVMKRLK